MQNGYPFRLPHGEFRDHYHMLVGGQVYKRLLFDPEVFAAYQSDPSQPMAQDRSRPKRYCSPVLPIVCSPDPFPSHRSKEKNRPFSREQCQVMVTLLVQCTGLGELRRCFVGKTKTFWQSGEQRLLSKLRQQRMHTGSVTIQVRSPYRSHPIKYYLTDSVLPLRMTARAEREVLPPLAGSHSGR